MAMVTLSLRRLSVKEYSYVGMGQAAVTFTQAGGAAAIVIFTLLFIAIIAIGYQTDSSLLSAGCFALWFLMVGWLVGLGLMNVYPTIWVGDEYLVISMFVFYRVAVAWTEIIDVGAGHVPFGHTLVRARHITPVHRLYGWLYSRTLHPSFIVGRWIQDRDELLREITWRVRQAQLSSPQDQ
jgi:hypothetical protein